MRREGNTIKVNLKKPISSPSINTLLILQSEKPSDFMVMCRNWLGLQQVIQTLYNSRTLSLDLYKEALAQKITRVLTGNMSEHQIFVQEGVLIPRYYNVYRLKPEDDIYWKWKPLMVDSHVSSLSCVCECLSKIESLLRIICDHLKNEPSAFVFLKPVDPISVPNYRKIIAFPMDLSTISRRIDAGYYTNYPSFHDDMLRVFFNGCTFNPCHDIWYQQCVVLKLCYMHIYNSICESGLLDKLNAMGGQSDETIVLAEKRDSGFISFTNASSTVHHIVSQNSKNHDDFCQRYMTEERTNSCPLLNYEIEEVIDSYSAGDNECFN